MNIGIRRLDIVRDAYHWSAGWFVRKLRIRKEDKNSIKTQLHATALTAVQLYRASAAFYNTRSEKTAWLILSYSVLSGRFDINFNTSWFLLLHHCYFYTYWPWFQLVVVWALSAGMLFSSWASWVGDLWRRPGDVRASSFFVSTDFRCGATIEFCPVAWCFCWWRPARVGSLPNKFCNLLL